MHFLEISRQRGVSMVNKDEGGQKHALPEHEETKVGVSAMNMDEGGERTNCLETRMQRGCEYREHR
jgi:hypothetical protein